MNEFTRKTIKFGLLLFGFCIVGAGLLSWVNTVTMKQIEINRLAEENRKRQQVLPLALEERFQEKIIDGNKYFLGYNGNGEYVGAVLNVESRGYNGPINITIGINPDGKVNGIAISKLDQGETPGLGLKITTRKFQEQFSGKDETELRLKKDDGKIDAITAATISSQAVVRAVRDGIVSYKKQIMEKI
ncbi:MAG: RnfABCDGE type electron transport complex subunit G [bacterium]|nr:RnfABCDGE type electron transport complex subunit G [bacterium]